MYNAVYRAFKELRWDKSKMSEDVRFQFFDPELDHVGRGQAAALGGTAVDWGAALKNLRSDEAKFIVSPFRRTIATALRVFPSLTWLAVEGCRERITGLGSDYHSNTYTPFLTTREIIPALTSYFADSMDRVDLSLIPEQDPELNTDHEDENTVKARVRTFLNDLLQCNAKVYVIVGHGAFFSSLFDILGLSLPHPLDPLRKLERRLTNCEVAPVILEDVDYLKQSLQWSQ